MKIKIRAHYQAAIELLELMSLASLIALLADAIWIVRDITVNGLTSGLFVVGVLLWTAFIMMAVGVYKYHIKAVKKILQDLLASKIQETKLKARVSRRMSK